MTFLTVIEYLSLCLYNAEVNTINCAERHDHLSINNTHPGNRPNDQTRFQPLKTQAKYLLTLNSASTGKASRSGRSRTMCRENERYIAGICQYCNVGSVMFEVELECHDPSATPPYWIKGLVGDPNVHCDFELLQREPQPSIQSYFGDSAFILPKPCLRCYGENVWSDFLDGLALDESTAPSWLKNWALQAPAPHSRLQHQNWQARPYTRQDEVGTFRPIRFDMWGLQIEQGPLTHDQHRQAILAYEMSRAEREGDPEYADYLRGQMQHPPESLDWVLEGWDLPEPDPHPQLQIDDPDQEPETDDPDQELET